MTRVSIASDPFDEFTRALTSPKRLYPPSKVLATIDPDIKGVYAWWFRNNTLPHVPLHGTRKFRAMSLLYVGTGPSSSTSRQFLRDRLKDHIGNDATRSTLRRSLGSLMAERLKLEFEVIRVSGRTRCHFGLGSGENDLSDWMEKNARVSWVICDRPWLLETHLIRNLSLPLNLKNNAQHPFRQTLYGLRRGHFAMARQKRTGL
jgi:hypothetical protein